eukprot:gnl/Chilomastix_cuspidata/8781.p2 GENE.gnl/Chilomastix_cuspidata/8781~~gnl/Chilomastix_cuspidata/8781.p2  ORF type:complete len:106 (+),score=19.22 gnl/Chilomastix_cuspidata/8781:287-604(+)
MFFVTWFIVSFNVKVLFSVFTSVIAPEISSELFKENSVDTILLFLTSSPESKLRVFIFTFALFKNSEKSSFFLISRLMSLKVPETPTFFAVLKPVHFTSKSPFNS